MDRASPNNSLAGRAGGRTNHGIRRRPCRQEHQGTAGAPGSVDRRHPRPGSAANGPGGSQSSARLFTGPRGGRITTATLRDATNWDEVVTKLGYEQLKRHSLRHTGLTWMADAGVPVHVLRKIAGHADLSTTQRYLHPDRQSVAGAGELLSKHLWSQNGPKLRVV